MDGCYLGFDQPSVVITMSQLGPLHIAEMWHGPTGAFKDLALKVVGRMVDRFLQRRGQVANVLVTTTGDTGSAAIHSVLGSKNTNIFVLYPRGRITRLQELQMTTVTSPNVKVYSTEGDGEECDVPVKNLFADAKFAKKHNLMSINSINVSRVLLQAVHYIYAYLQVCPKVDREVVFSIPTGSMGNITGGYLAYLMGLPIHLLAAVNANDILHRVITSGIVSTAAQVPTHSSAMDNKLPYNIERLFYFLSGGDCEIVKDIMEEVERKGSCKLPDELLEGNKCVTTMRVSDEETLSTIKVVWEDFQYPLCPHSAVGVQAALDYLKSRGKEKNGAAGGDDMVVVLATATAAKFPEILEKARVPAPSVPALTGLSSRPEAKLYLDRGEDWAKDWEKVLRQDIRGSHINS